MGGGAGDELQVHIEVCSNGSSMKPVGVKGGAPEKFLQSTPYNSMGNALTADKIIKVLVRKSIKILAR